MTEAKHPRHGLMMFSIMLSTVVYTLDSTIAAVALPNMQGSFSATQDQAAWVLTSYIVSSAIMTPMAGYLGDRFGRRNVFLMTVAGFVLTSMACGLAVNLEEMVFFRILQGAFGAPMIPFAQATILDAYTPTTYGRGMALFGAGVMLGPIIGPTLGGWLTEALNWRWVFFINLPVGAIAFTGLWISMRDSHTEDRSRPFDFAGFAWLALCIGALQLMFDRGNTLSWFQSTEIRIEAFVAVLCAYLFIVQICTRERPFIEPSIFRDRNFTMATLLGFVLGFNMMASMALLPPFMQTLLNYPVLDTGMLLAPRGVGMMISMTLVGRLVERVDARHVITLGLLVSAYSVWEMTLFDINVQESQLMYTGFVQGIGMGCTFVPLSTIAFSTIDPRKRADAVGFYSLGRNVGSSIGVSILMGALAVFVRQNRSWLTNEINPYNHVLGGGVLPAQMDLSNKAGLEMFNFIVQREAMMLGYLNDFRLMLVFSLIAIPLVYVMRDGRPRSGR